MDMAHTSSMLELDKKIWIGPEEVTPFYWLAAPHLVRRLRIIFFVHTLLTHGFLHAPIPINESEFFVLRSPFKNVKNRHSFFSSFSSSLELREKKMAATTHTHRGTDAWRLNNAHPSRYTHNELYVKEKTTRTRDLFRLHTLVQIERKKK